MGRESTPTLTPESEAETVGYAFDISDDAQAQTPEATSVADNHESVDESRQEAEKAFEEISQYIEDRLMELGKEGLTEDEANALIINELRSRKNEEEDSIDTEQEPTDVDEDSDGEPAVSQEKEQDEYIESSAKDVLSEGQILQSEGKEAITEVTTGVQEFIAKMKVGTGTPKGVLLGLKRDRQQRKYDRRAARLDKSRFKSVNNSRARRAEKASQRLQQTEDEIDIHTNKMRDIIGKHESVQKERPLSMNSVNPYETGADGLTKAAITGIEGSRILRDDEPVPRYEGLTEEQSAIQEEFCEWWEDPEKRKEALDFADDIAERGAINGVPVYETDAIKQLDPHWGKDSRLKELREKIVSKEITQEERDELDGYMKYRQENNTLLHQAANAIAKAAFERAAAGVEGDILFTSGGCASGKGYGLEQAAKGNPIYASIGEKLSTTSLIWDAAGDQCGTELGWAQSLIKPNSKLHVVHTDADPGYIASNPRGGLVERANSKGRMVDAAVYALSHFLGAQNLLAFKAKNSENPNVTFTFLRAKSPKTLGGQYVYREGVHPKVREVQEFTGSVHKPTTIREVIDIIEQVDPKDFDLQEKQFRSILEGARFIDSSVEATSSFNGKIEERRRLYE